MARRSRQHGTAAKVALVGGPWDGQVFRQRPAYAGKYEHDSAALSLPIRVGEHVGRYNLNTGAWTPLTGEKE